MFVSFTTDPFDSNEFAQVPIWCALPIGISVFFLYGLEKIPCPTRAIVLHSDVMVFTGDLGP